MKTKLLFLSFVFALPAFAGTSAKEVAPATSDPCNFAWFTGASVGYLTEFEEPMYNVHLGTDTCWKLLGCDVAFFAEIGYTQKDDDYDGNPLLITAKNNVMAPALSFNNGDSFSPDEMEDALKAVANVTGFDTGYDLDVMPITFNVKLERQLTGNLNAYFGAGLGAALVDLDIDAGPFGDFSDSDWVFTAQVFAGVNYNFTPNFEVYSGLRWIYFDDASLGDNGSSADLSLDDDFLIELGVRYNF